MILPKPPSQEERYLFEDTNKFGLYSWAAFSLLSLLAGMGLFVLAHPYFWAYSLVVCLLTFYLLTSYIIGLFGESNKPITFPPLTRRPSVDIYYPICGEPRDVCHNALSYIMALQRAYGNEAHVYILDDSKDEMGKDLLEWFKDLGNISRLRRPDPGKDKKAGNLRYAFAKTPGEFIAIFDADFCPTEDYLEKLLPFLVDDSNVAILQTPQFFTVEDHLTWVGRGSANVQELFYRLIQVNRNTFNAAICVGTCAIYRRVALEPFGGTALVNYSEDVRTGFNCIKAGWRLRFIPYNFAKGLCPDDLSGFVNQQYRWSLGSMSLCFSKEFWTANITFMQRLCYMSGMLYYITTGLGLFLTFVPCALVLIFAPQLMHWYNIIFAIPSLVYGTLIYSRWSQTTWGIHTPRSRQAAFYCHLLALMDYMRGSLVPWEPTGAVKKNKLYDRYQALVSFRLWSYTLAVLSLMLWRLPETQWFNFIPTLILLAIDVALNRSVK